MKIDNEITIEGVKYRCIVTEITQADGKILYTGFLEYESEHSFLGWEWKSWNKFKKGYVGDGTTTVWVIPYKATSIKNLLNEAWNTLCNELREDKRWKEHKKNTEIIKSRELT